MAGNLRRDFRAADREEMAEIRAHGVEVEEYRSGEVAELVEQAAAEIRATVPRIAPVSAPSSHR